MKIASTKNDTPSSANPSPNTWPNDAMNSGHSRPNSNDRIVPVTTPTANRISATFDQRLASALYVASPVRRYSPSTNRNIAGNAIPKQTIGMCTVSDSACIWRASFASGWACPPSVSTTCCAKTSGALTAGWLVLRGSWNQPSGPALGAVHARHGLVIARRGAARADPREAEGEPGQQVEDAGEVVDPRAAPPKGWRTRGRGGPPAPPRPRASRSASPRRTIHLAAWKSLPGRPSSSDS